MAHYYNQYRPASNVVCLRCNSDGGDYKAVVPKHQVFIDGACPGNHIHGVAHKAGMGIFWPGAPRNNLSVRIPRMLTVTNNSAEIMAAIEACKQAKWLGIADITLHSDSKYLVDSFLEGWAETWVENNCKKPSGMNVENRRDFEDLLNAMHFVEVEWKWITREENVEADRLANAALLKPMPYVCDDCWSKYYRDEQDFVDQKYRDGCGVSINNH